MKIKSHRSTIKAIRPGDSVFHISDGLIQTPRAGFEVDNLCPKEYQAIIFECIQVGWLKPVAYMKDAELMWTVLTGK